MKHCHVYKQLREEKEQKDKASSYNGQTYNKHIPRWDKINPIMLDHSMYWATRGSMNVKLL